MVADLGVGPRTLTECADDGSTADLLVVYTPAARNALGGAAGIEAMIALAELQTDLAYENSLIDTTVRVVMTREIDYQESGDAFVDRDRLAALTDGFMDEVHAWRDRVSADVVSLIVETLDACGVAYFSVLPGNVPAPELAFNVVRADCASGNYTFAHELGHNQGARHNREVDPSNDGVFPYAHGYQDPGGAFRTVMSYDCPDGCPRVLHFSNPEVLYGGSPTGRPIDQPDSAHNALTISTTAFNVANFRPSQDCNLNGVCDSEEIGNGTAPDCNGNGTPDECEADCNSSGIPDDCDVLAGTSPDCNGNGIPDECLALENDCNGNGVPDACDITTDTSDDCTANGVPDECESDCDQDGLADVCAIAAGTAQDVNANGYPDSCEPPVLYVDPSPDPGGLGNGTSWPDAFTSLSAALKVAAASVGRVEEIRVAAGLYMPDAAGLPDPRAATFELVEGVALRGGFAGFGVSDPDSRDAVLPGSILSGDLDGNDGPAFANNQDNTYHVVTAYNLSAAAVLDGFTIRGGNADGAAVSEAFSADGAGMLIVDGGPSITNCAFVANRAGRAGGGVHCERSSAVFSRCIYTLNVGGQGGAVSVEEGGPWLVDCRFIENAATGWDTEPGLGGALRISTYATPTVVNGVFSRNAAERGGAVANLDHADPLLTNCTMSGNTAFLGQSAYNEQFSSPRLLNGIVWGASAGQIHNEDGLGPNSPEVSFSCVKGGWFGLSAGGNISDDPLFADPALDDLRLEVHSPCVDAGDRAAVPPSVTADADGTARFVDVAAVADTGSGPAPLVDMGAFEASDCNGNGVNDIHDVLAGTSTDCDGDGVPDDCAPDCNGNGAADPCDIAAGTSGDCNANTVPDDCEPDCNANGLTDECDVLGGGSPDANGNGVPDECDADCNGNGVPDDLECLALDPPHPGGTRPCTTDGDCIAGATCLQGVCYTPRNRYVWLGPPAPGCRSAMRVTDLGSGRSYWVQAPDGNGVARLGPAPHHQDWSTSPAEVRVGDCAIVPVAEYAVQAISEGCDPSNELSYSVPLVLPTTPQPTPNHWADCVGAFQQVCRDDENTPCIGPGDCPGGVCGVYLGPDGYVNFDDVGAAVKAFQKVAGTVWPETTLVDIHGDESGDARIDPPNFVVNFADIQHMVLAFQGGPYPFAEAAACP